MPTRKVGVVGVGAVGQACAFALLLRGSCRELVLVDRAADRAKAAAADMRYGAPLSPARTSCSSARASTRRTAAPPTATTRAGV